MTKITAPTTFRGRLHIIIKSNFKNRILDKSCTLYKIQTLRHYEKKDIQRIKRLCSTYQKVGLCVQIRIQFLYEKYVKCEFTWHFPSMGKLYLWSPCGQSAKIKKVCTLAGLTAVQLGSVASVPVDLSVIWSSFRLIWSWENWGEGLLSNFRAPQKAKNGRMLQTCGKAYGNACFAGLLYTG